MAGNQPTGGTSGGGNNGIYGNPLRALRSLQASRIDMGVDYSGTGPVYAIGPGVVEEVDQSWAGGYGGTGPGTFIKYRITEGPLKGKRWYVAENIHPSVKVGDKVTARTVLGQASGSFETGYAGTAPGTTAAQEAGQIPTQGDPGQWSTGYGIAASDTLQATGAPAGQKTIVTASSGGVPSWLPEVLKSISLVLIPGLGVAGKVAGGITGGLSGIGELAHWAGKIVLSLTDIYMWISLGWILLGVWLLWLGISLWLKLPQKAIDFGASTAARAI